MLQSTGNLAGLVGCWILDIGAKSEGASANVGGAGASQAGMTGAADRQMVEHEPERCAGGAGPHVWIARLMDRDGPGIVRMLRRMLGNEQDVMDAYQDCFCKLARRPVGDRPANARAYAYRTAGNIAIELIRGRKRRREHQPAIAEHQRKAGGVATGEGLSAEQRDSLREAIALLPRYLGNVIVLRDLSRMSYREVGKTLGIDPATARVYRRHAVVKLAELLCGEAEE